jgi:[ribosomal protein S5]-alanine N-acetyltransferase
MNRTEIQIETARLRIRDFMLADAMDLQEIFGDDETMRYVETVYDRNKTDAFLLTFCIERKGAVAVLERVSKKVIGYILFNAIMNGVYEIGWIFNKQYWRKGYAYEACSAVINHAFSDLHVHKIVAEAIDEVKSVGLMQKLGMIWEGTLRSHTKDYQGNWTDLHLYGLLQSDRGA